MLKLLLFGLGILAVWLIARLINYGLYRLDAYRINPQVRAAMNEAYLKVQFLRINGSTADPKLREEQARAGDLVNEALDAIHAGHFRTAWANAQEATAIVDRIQPSFTIAVPPKPVALTIVIQERPGTLVWFGTADEELIARCNPKP